jgi:hypothetical protein
MHTSRCLLTCFFFFLAGALAGLDPDPGDLEGACLGGGAALLVLGSMGGAGAGSARLLGGAAAAAAAGLAAAGLAKKLRMSREPAAGSAFLLCMGWACALRWRGRHAHGRSARHACMCAAMGLGFICRHAKQRAGLRQGETKLAMGPSPSSMRRECAGECHAIAKRPQGSDLS